MAGTTIDRTSWRMASLRAGVLALAVLLSGCEERRTAEEQRAAEHVDRVLASRPREPLVEDAEAVFYAGIYTTIYRVDVRLGDDADDASKVMSARWEGPNCGESGVITDLTKFQPAVMVQERGAFTLDPALLSWRHPHPPCTADPSHGDVTVKVTITNPSGTLVCTFTGAQSGKGTCVDPPRAPLPGARPSAAPSASPRGR